MLWVNRFCRSLATFAVLLSATGVPDCAQGDPGDPIVMVTSHDSQPYQQVLDGFRSYLVDRGVDRPFVTHSLLTDAAEAKHALAAAHERGAVPLLTVGSAATQTALKMEGDAPVIACMIVDAQDLKDSPNATGVILEFPLETQFRWMRRFIPRGRTIGVLFNPEENRAQIKAASRIARKHGLRLVARQVERPQALPAALSSLAKEADVLWGLADQLVLSPQTAEAILLFSFRNRIPFTGLSNSWVKAGALYALDRDYEDIGAQCGEMAHRILGGARPSALPPARPRKLTYAVNQRTAEHMKLEIPAALLKGAERVFH
jgi:putative ABC transport system substrate-binding protein